MPGCVSFAVKQLLCCCLKQQWLRFTAAQEQPMPSEKQKECCSPLRHSNHTLQLLLEVWAEGESLEGMKAAVAALPQHVTAPWVESDQVWAMCIGTRIVLCA